MGPNIVHVCTSGFLWDFFRLGARMKSLNKIWWNLLFFPPFQCQSILKWLKIGYVMGPNIVHVLTSGFLQELFHLGARNKSLSKNGHNLAKFYICWLFSMLACFKLAKIGICYGPLLHCSCVYMWFSSRFFLFRSSGKSLSQNWQNLAKFALFSTFFNVFIF